MLLLLFHKSSPDMLTIPDLKKRASEICLSCLLVALSACTATPDNSEDIQTDVEENISGNVIFIHPDGAGSAAWAIQRLIDYGPDGMSNWDKLPQLGLYRGHLEDAPVSTSNGGGTSHAFGRKGRHADYGFDDGRTALSGKTQSILIEAQAAGIAVGIINSGHIAEPGTGIFAASAPSRKMKDLIAARVIESGVDLILSGGEIYLLPEGVVGFHGVEGERKDGRNLIEEARAAGYSVVYTKGQLDSVAANTTKLLGVFAAYHTFNDMSEEDLAAKNLPLYNPSAPSVGEMTAKALEILGQREEPFYLVVEEEGSDNFANDNNAQGTIEALRRADAAIGHAHEFCRSNDKTLLITASDSDAGSPAIYGLRDSSEFDKDLPSRMENGAPLDGIKGSNSPAFSTAADKNGRTFRFGVAWAGFSDLGGSVMARAAGLNSEQLPPNVDNTDVYRLMYLTLFGRRP